ncbi:MAG TPA: protein kinase [Thermoanaerobaculia bacterium]|jgi:serine/threonine-protein kinase|nr:protein kinase [Thermoanaerobaculia bacterium]
MMASPGFQGDTPGPPPVLDGKYRLDERLGEGAVGLVYRATHLGLKKVFALKLLKPGPALDPFSVSRFQREAEALGRLRHSHIVEVTDFGVDPGTGAPYLVMELLDGVPLSDLCREGPLPLARALPILDAIAAAVDAAHEQGILHRDLKPGNVLLCGPEGEDRTAKVLDFGLAEISAPPHLLDVVDEEALVMGEEEKAPSLTVTGGLLGTPLYVAPEVIRGEPAGRASDLYSFGVIAYEMLVGRPPFSGSTRQVLAGHLEREPSPPEGALPAGVWKALREPLAKDPARRPATAAEIVRRLRVAANEEDRARWRRAELPRRALLSVALAASAAVAALLLPPAGLPAVERWLYDLRLRASPALAPDPRILLVIFDEASLAGGSPPLADRADEIGRTLDRIFAAGARGVAVDFLLPDAWNASQGFSDLVLRHSEALTLAAFSNPEGKVVGTGSLAGLTASALGPRRAAEIFGFVNLDEDPDGAVRRGRLWFRDSSSSQRPSWAARATREFRPDLARENATGPSFWIDTRIDWNRYARISWRQVPAALDRNPGLFRNRLAVVGGDFQGSGDDYHRIRHRSGGSRAVSGLTLQALMVDTIEAGLPIREPGRMPFLAATILGIGLAMAGILCARRPGPIAAGLAVGAIVYLALSFPVFRRTGLMLPVTAPLLLVLLGLLAALLLRRNFPQPPEVSIP